MGASISIQESLQTDKGFKFTLLSLAIQVLIKSGNDLILNDTLDRILTVVESEDFKIDENLNIAESLLIELRQHDKKDNSLFSKVVSKLEDEIKKTKKS